MKKVLFTVFCYLFIAGVAVGKNKQNDRELIDRVAGWQIDNFAKVKHKNLDWTNGALYRGMIEWADYTNDKKYYDFLMGIGQKNSWDFCQECIMRMIFVWHKCMSVCIGNIKILQ